MGLSERLSAALVKIFGVTLEEEELTREAVEKDFSYIMYFAGCYLPLTPRYVIFSIGYNLLLASVTLMHNVLSAAIALSKELTVDEVSLLVNLSVISFLASVTHATLFMHRSSITHLYGGLALCTRVVPRPPDPVLKATKTAFNVGWPVFLLLTVSLLLFIGPLIDKGKLGISRMVPIDFGSEDSMWGEVVIMAYTLVFSYCLLVSLTAGVAGFVLIGQKVVSELRLAIQNTRDLAEVKDDQEYHSRLKTFLLHHATILQ